MRFFLKNVVILISLASSGVWAVSPILMEHFGLSSSDFVSYGGKEFLKNSINLTERMTPEMRKRAVPAQWFDQCLDHFGDPSCTKTWKQVKIGT
jgi:hypothetical protein